MIRLYYHNLPNVKLLCVEQNIRATVSPREKPMALHSNTQSMHSNIEYELHNNEQLTEWIAGRIQ